MKKNLAAIGFFMLLGGIGLALIFGSPREPTSRQAFVPGEALIKFKPYVGRPEAERLISGAGGVIQREIPPHRIYVITFSKEIAPEEMVRRLEQMPQVSYAELNGVMQALGADWDWDPFAAGVAWAGENKEPLGAGAKVRVAVIDTAIDANHPTLAGKVVGGYNFVNNTTNTQSTGSGLDWHGTASTGRILDGAGDANVEIMPVTVLSSGGSGTWGNVVQGITYAADNGAQVINMSLGGSGYSKAVQDAIDYAVSKGVVVVAAAGNTGRDQAFYPAAYRGVISVAATNEAGKKAGFSTYHSTVDISAPGDTQKLLTHGGGTRTARGTSFSAPFIAGMAVMLKSAFPSLNCGQVEQVIKAKANGLAGKNDPRYDGKMGSGFLNALDIGKWMADIRAGTFRFPWGAAPPRPAPPAPGPAPQPRPQPNPGNQPWLARGKGNSGTYVVTPAGEVVKE